LVPNCKDEIDATVEAAFTVICPVVPGPELLEPLLELLELLLELPLDELLLEWLPELLPLELLPELLPLELLPLELLPLELLPLCTPELLLELEPELELELEVEVGEPPLLELEPDPGELSPLQAARQSDADRVKYRAAFTVVLLALLARVMLENVASDCNASLIGDRRRRQSRQPPRRRMATAIAVVPLRSQATSAIVWRTSLSGAKLRGSAQSETQTRQQREYARTPDQIAPGQPLRVLQQPKQPLDAQALHPARRTPLRSREEIDRGAHA
jgi:hypothetical protein